MEAPFGLTSSSVNLRAAPDLKSHIVEALNPQEHLRVIDETGDMWKVQATRWHPPIPGYTLKSSVIVDPGKHDFFSQVEIKPGLSIAAVPPSIPLPTFLTWLNSGAESPWLPADYAASIASGERPSVGGQIRQAIANRQSDWEAWTREVTDQGRLSSATISEWLVITAGGRTAWTIRPERIFKQPSEHAAAPAWVAPQDVLRWTGHVRVNDSEPKYKNWYEVEFTKLDRQFKGWFKAALLEEFVIPSPATDLTNPDNAHTVFDLTRPRLHIPGDPEIAAARQAGRNGAQYIEISGAIRSTAIKHNLCGEFCVAALGGSDVIPFLRTWLSAYGPAASILQGDLGTSIFDLQKMLDALGKKSEFFRAEASVAPITPSYVRKMLDTGRMAIIGTGVTYNGVVKCGSRTRHWVVIEDIVPVGNSGWVRLYNPFPDREEVYPFDAVFDISSRSAIGLWVDPTLPA